MFVLLLGLSGYSISNASNVNNVDPLSGSHIVNLAFAESHNSDGESEDEDNDEQQSELEEETEDGEIDEELEDIDEETESEGSDGHDSEKDANKAIADAEDEIKRAQEKIVDAKEKGKVTSASEVALEEAQGRLEEAKQNLESGFFQMAEELADEAEDLASDARMSLLGKNIEDEDEIEADEEEVEEQETEIEVEIKNGKAKITIEFEDEKSKFLLDTTDENKILSAITDKTGLAESEIRGIWDFESEDEDSDADDSAHTARRDARDDARQDAQDRVSELEQKISQLEQRIQSLLQRLETGEYFGRMGDPEPITESFSLSFDGSATSIGDATAADLSGEIFVESLSTSNRVSTFRVTGGELFVGDELYDVVFGKMRIIMSGNQNTNDTILLISEVIDEQGDITTLRLSFTSDVSLGGDFTEPVNLKMLSPQSKIAGQWFLDASAQMTPLNS